MRHVSRTHRVVLEWLFDKIDLDPKIRIKYVETKNQLADIVTKKSFSRDEWNHLLRLFDIMSFSMFSCSHFLLSNTKQSAMSRRAREGTSKEGSAVAKPRQWIWCQETSWVRRSSARFEPSSASMSVTSTRRSTAPPKTRILRTNTTQQSPPLNVLIYLDILELQTAANWVHTEIRVIRKLPLETIGRLWIGWQSH